MLLIGEYTEFPAWLPADPGSGIALFNSTEGAEPLANTVLSVHNPSFLCADIRWILCFGLGSLGAINTFYSRRLKFLSC